MSPKRVVVLGGTGFVGRNVAELLAQEPHRYSVIATWHRTLPFKHDAISWRQCDLREAAQVSQALAGADIVVHAAATTSGAKDIVERPYQHVTDNAVMGSLIFRAAFELGIAQLLFFSCSVMYPSQEAPLRESDFDASRELPQPYRGVGWTKVYLEKMCEFYAGLGKTRFTVLRHSNIYGPHDKFDLEKSHVFGATVAKVYGSTDGTLTIWGDGKASRDLLHVDDLSRAVALSLSAELSPFELMNIGYGQAVPIKELVARIIRASGRALTVRHDLSKPSIGTKLCLDSSRALRLIGWKPEIDLDAGIQKTLRWYTENYS